MASSILPEDSLERLSALAASALRGRASASRDASGQPTVRVSIAPLTLPIQEGLLTCADATAPDGMAAPVTLPPGARAWALIALRNGAATTAASGEQAVPGLALCVSYTERHEWTAMELDILRTLATTVDTELQLRADLGRHAGIVEAEEDALHDLRTDLASRALFIDRLQMALLRSQRYPERRFALLSLAVEQFHSIETTLGYDVAGDVLREFGRRLKTAVRAHDSIGHIAGDQFAILLESIRDESDPARVATRVHESLRSRIATRWGEVMVSANIGIVLNPSGAESAGRLMQLAGLARTRASANASAYEIYDHQMQEHARTRLQKEMELRRAVEESQFDLHYQPIISLATGRIVQTEALVRWRHPQRGLLAAAEFIGLAEETGLAVPMGWFTMNTACRQLQQWRAGAGPNGSLSMSINVTAAHFKQRDVAEHVGAILKNTGVSTGINFEVTERLLIGDPAKAADILNALRQLGIRIHLDDFGTGYSSLQYLHDLPFDAIKIDRTFIGRMRNGGRDAQIVATIRELARQLGVPVIAEGVETAEHLALVRDLGCEFAQGYYFARPMPAADVASLISSGPQW